MTSRFIKLAERLPDERELGPGPRPNLGEPAQLTPEREVHANTHTRERIHFVSARMHVNTPRMLTHGARREVWRGSRRIKTLGDLVAHSSELATKSRTCTLTHTHWQL